MCGGAESEGEPGAWESRAWGNVLGSEDGRPGMPRSLALALRGEGMNEIFLEDGTMLN